MSARYDNQFFLVEPAAILDGNYNDFTNSFGGWAEPDAAAGDPSFAWSSGFGYLIGDRVYYQHNIYQRTTDGSGVIFPDTDTANWVKVSAVNRWKMFDGSNSTQTTRSSATAPFSVTWFVAVSYVNTAVFDNISCDTIQLRVRTGGVTGTIIYDSTQNVAGKTAAIFQNLPRNDTSYLEFIATSNSTSKDIKIGTLVIGTSFIVGDPQYGATVGIIDFSTKTADTFGNYSVVERGYSKRMSVPVEIDNFFLDDVAAILAQYRAKPAMWLGAGSLFTSMLMYGYYRNFEIVVPGTKHSLCNIEIEGLS